MSADVLSYLRRLLPAVDPQGSDGELLRRYVATGAEGEFTELLRRHGPLVWSVCRRVLGDAHAAEDVFQATFLQLARKAGTLRRDGSLAGWLHTVATRLARRALRAEQRRRRRERVHVLSHPPSADDLTWRELRQMLDAEIARLPEAYRQPLILCYLENRSQIEAAHRLGLPQAVLRGRLERGRQKLRQRLEKLGLPLAAMLLLAKTETVPAALLEATRQTVCSVLAGGPVPPSIAALAAGGSLLSRLKIGLLASILLIVGGVGIGSASRQAGPKEKPKDDPPKAEAARQDLHGDPLPAGALARSGHCARSGCRIRTWPSPPTERKSLRSARN